MSADETVRELARRAGAGDLEAAKRLVEELQDLRGEHPEPPALAFDEWVESVSRLRKGALALHVTLGHDHAETRIRVGVSPGSGELVSVNDETLQGAFARAKLILELEAARRGWRPK